MQRATKQTAFAIWGLTDEGLPPRAILGNPKVEAAKNTISRYRNVVSLFREVMRDQEAPPSRIRLEGNDLARARALTGWSETRTLEVFSWWREYESTRQQRDASAGVATAAEAELVTLPARQQAVQKHQTDLHDTAERFKSQLLVLGPHLLWLPDLPAAGAAAGVKWETPKAGPLAGLLTLKLDIEDDFLLPCLEEHISELPIWDNFLQWKRTGGRLIGACHAFLGMVRKRAQEETRLKTLPNLNQPSLHPNFSLTIFADAVYRAEHGKPWINIDYHSEEKPQGMAILRWGAYGLAMIRADKLQSLRDKHKALRDEFGTLPQVKVILYLAEEVNSVRQLVGRALDEMVRAGFFKGTCRLCRQWLTQSR